jgi:hypothetical protein
MTLPSTLRALLEMQARDNGFDRQLPAEGDWLVFASTKAPLKVGLTALGDGLPLVAFSQLNVAKALGDHGTELMSPMPAGAVAVRMVKDGAGLRELLRRAFQLARALPDKPLQVFKVKTAKLPRATEIEKLVVQRIGQDIFRASLLEYFDGTCAVTGLALPELLRASHIKPWAACELDEERLAVFNGILLSLNLDALFDRGFITFEDEGGMLMSKSLPAAAAIALGIDASGGHAAAGSVLRM